MLAMWVNKVMLGHRDSLGSLEALDQLDSRAQQVKMETWDSLVLREQLETQEVQDLQDSLEPQG